MTLENIERGFLWRDYDNVLALSNITVQGFLSVLNESFDIDSPSYTGLNSRLRSLTLWTAIKNKLLDEATMDIVARQMNFPAWEYVGRFNLIAPFDTVLKRKQEMLLHIFRLMRFRGTPYTIVEALLAFGFTDVSIHENISVFQTYDGTYYYNGVVTYAADLKHQLFSVELTTLLDLKVPPVPDEQLDAIVNIVNAFKKERPELYQVTAHTPTVPAGDVRQIWNN